MLTPAQSEDLPAASAAPPRTLDSLEDAACLRLFQDQLGYVHYTLGRLGAPPDDIEDLLQEVFLALRGSWRRCDRSRPLRPYLFGIAFRVAAAHRRKRDREVPFGTVDLLDVHADLDQRMLDTQARRMVSAALDRLPLPRRAVLIMHELDDVPVATIASTLRIPVFTVYSRLRKARRELAAAMRRMLKHDSLDESGFFTNGQPDMLADSA